MMGSFRLCCVDVDVDFRVLVVVRLCHGTSLGSYHALRSVGRSTWIIYLVTSQSADQNGWLISDQGLPNDYRLHDTHPLRPRQTSGAGCISSLGEHIWDLKKLSDISLVGSSDRRPPDRFA